MKSKTKAIRRVFMAESTLLKLQLMNSWNENWMCMSSSAWWSPIGMYSVKITTNICIKRKKKPNLNLALPIGSIKSSPKWGLDRMSHTRQRLISPETPSARKSKLDKLSSWSNQWVAPNQTSITLTMRTGTRMHKLWLRVPTRSN